MFIEIRKDELIFIKDDGRWVGIIRNKNDLQSFVGWLMKDEAKLEEIGKRIKQWEEGLLRHEETSWLISEIIFK